MRALGVTKLRCRSGEKESAVLLLSTGNSEQSGKWPVNAGKRAVVFDTRNQPRRSGWVRHDQAQVQRCGRGPCFFRRCLEVVQVSLPVAHYLLGVDYLRHTLHTRVRFAYESHRMYGRLRQEEDDNERMRMEIWGDIWE